MCQFVKPIMNVLFAVIKWVSMQMMNFFRNRLVVLGLVLLATVLVSAAALHSAGEHGAVSGGAAADGRLSSAAAAAEQHQHHGQDRTAARGPAALLQGGSARGQHWATDSAQVRLLHNLSVMP